MLNKWINWFLQKRNFATILLVVFLTQFVWIEGYTISYVKVGIMALCPVMMLMHRLQITKATILCAIIYIYVIISASFHPESFRASTLVYKLLFLLMYIVFYSFVHTEAFTLPYFIKIVKFLIFAYCICLVLQQICVLVGIHYIPIINLNNQSFLSIHKLPSLAIEPSHSAKILGVLFYAYLKCNEIVQGSKVTLSQIFNNEHKLVTYAFLWPMLTMGSGTAFLCMGILSLYFMKGFQFLYAIPIFVSIYFIMNFFEVSQFERVRVTTQATLTGDAQEVAEADGSAAVRIKPLLNTLHLDYTKAENWFGRGCDAGLQHGLYGDDRYLAGISDFGLVYYILSIVFTYTCICNFWSLPSLMIFMGIGGGIGNVVNCWGMQMVFTCVTYFLGKYGRNE